MSWITDAAKAQTTKWFIWGVASFAIAIDIWWALNGREGDTISEVSLAYSYQYVTIPAAYGVLTGHLFWGHRGEVSKRGGRTAGLVVLALLALSIDALGLFDVMPIVPLVSAIPLGRLLWPQSIPREAPLFVWTHK